MIRTRVRPLTVALPALIALAGCNQPPGTPDVALTPETPRTLDDLVVSYGGSVDPNTNDVVEYRIAWFRDDNRVESLQDDDRVRAVETRKGETWRVVVTPFDGDELGQAAQAEVTIANTPPSATVSINPETPTTTDTVRTSVTKRDDDIDPVSVRYEWVLNGSVTSVTARDLPDQRTNKGDVWEVRVIPSDADGDGEPAVREFTIVNTPPEVDQATIEPAMPDKDSTLVCRGTGWTDVDEDPPGYQVEWRVGGEVISTDAELDGAVLTRGDRVSCRLTPFDGEDAGEAVVSDDVVVQNTPPRATRVTISPDDPLKGDVITASVEGATDPDGDEVTFRYAWRVNGTGAGSGETLPSSRFRKGDTISLSITPTDGVDDGESLTSNTVTAGNNPPKVDLVTLSPADVFTNDVIEATAIASDPDGDTLSLTYTWYVDGSRVAVTGTELDGATWFDKDQEVYVEVTAADGEDTSPVYTTDTLTIRNSVPTAPGVVFDPESPTEGDDILCVIDEDATDADDDSLTYTFVWEKGGTAVTGGTKTTYANDTFPAELWQDGDDLVCKVTASDGTDVSDAGLYGLPYGTADNPGVDCQDILTNRPWYESKAYYIDPDEDGDTSDAIEVWCDMETDGGGWTVTYYVDATNFDGYAANDTSSSSKAPTKINDTGEIWNVPSDLSYTENLFACTTQNDKATHYWRFKGKQPYSDYIATSSRTYVYTTSDASSTTAAACASAYKGGGTSYPLYYGYFALNHTSCSTNRIVWGMWHYYYSAGSNSTDTTRGTFRSPYRSRNIWYPICDGDQTSNGKFWIGVR